MNKLIRIIVMILSLHKILFFKFLWLKVSIFDWIVFFGWPKIRYPNLIKIGKNFQLWRFSRMTGNIEIWNDVFVNEFSSINAWTLKNSQIIIWNNVMFWPWCFLQAWDHSFKKWEIYMYAEWWKSGNIIIWNNVWVWARTIILKWVTIGDNSVIWAWSVVTKDIPSWYVAVWNPAHIIKEIP